MKSAVAMHIEPEAMCMVTIVLFLSHGRSKIQRSKGSIWVPISDILFAFFSSVGKKHLNSAYICKEPIHTFIWHLGTAQHTLASVIIWFKYLLFLFSWRLFVLLKYNLGASWERGFWRWLSIQEALWAWEATVQRSLSFGNVLGVYRIKIKCCPCPLGLIRRAPDQWLPENKQHPPLKKFVLILSLPLCH